jgi:hypothetical protein
VVAFLVGAAVAAAAVAVVTERARRSQDDRASRLVAERDDLAARNDILASRVDGLDRRVEGLERALARSRRRARLAARVAAPDEARPGDVTVDLGGWDGLFRVDGTAVGFRDGVAEVGGVIEFLGGAPCPLGRIELTASFLAGGNSIASGVWQAPTLAEGEPAPFFIEAPASAVADEAEITMTDARCAS